MAISYQLSPLPPPSEELGNGFVFIADGTSQSIQLDIDGFLKVLGTGNASSIFRLTLTPVTSPSLPVWASVVTGYSLSNKNVVNINLDSVPPAGAAAIVTLIVLI